MGVEGLLKYILKTPSTREKVKLKDFAAAHLKKTGKHPEILCDFTAVVSWLLSSYDYALIETDSVSPYCLLYGGLLEQYSSRVLSFVRVMESHGLKVVFFIEGSPVSESNMSALYDTYVAQSSQKQLECAKILQICGSHLDMTQLQWSFREGILPHVLFALEAAGTARMVYCKGQVLRDVISYMLNNKHVCGILSSNTSYAIPAGCGLFLLDLFGLNVRHANLLLSYQDLSCEVVWSTWLASALELSPRQLADLAIVCGNEYTHYTNTKSKLSLTLGVPLSVLEVAEWLRSSGNSLEEISEMAEFLNSNPRYQYLIEISHGAYLSAKQQDGPPDLLQSHPIMKAIVLAGGFPSSQMISLITDDMYWRPSLVEPEIRNCPRFCDITILVRTCIYALMGMSQITEIGHVTAGAQVSRITTDVACKVDVSTLLCLPQRSRLGILYRLVTFPGVFDGPEVMGNIISGAITELQEEGDYEVPSEAVLVCSLVIFMRAANLRLKPSPDIFICELEALLVTLLCSLAGFPALNLSHLPPAKGVTLACWFSHLIDQVYWLASCLGLSRDLVPPGKLFSSHRYLPFHLSGVLCEDFDPDCMSTLWSKLRQVCAFYQEVWELAPVLELRTELLKQTVPPLSRVVKAFNQSLEALTSSEKLRELANELEQVSIPTSPPPVTDKPDVDGFLLDLDESPVSSGESSHTLELSFVQECNATEEDHFFSSQSLGPCTCELATQSCDEEEGEGRELYGVDFESDYDEDETEASNLGSLEVEKAVGSILDFSEAVTDVARRGASTPLTPSHTRTVDTDPTSLLGPPPQVDEKKLQCSLLHAVPQDSTLQPAPPTNPSPQKSALPIMEHRQQILKLVHEHAVVCIEGETGCGKSTKVPQFILDEALSQTPPTNCRILVTQPRRVAAIKLAERVSAERRERLGTTVGYCVGGDHHRAAKTMLTYCTVGYLLQVLVHHPMAIQWYSHIILDEIHERSIDTDFALLVVRKLVSENNGSTKIVIMSATMQGGLLVNYFTERFHFSQVSSPYFVGAKHYPVQEFFMDQLAELADQQKVYWHQKQQMACNSLRSMAGSQPHENLKASLLSTPRVTDYAMNVCTNVIISQCKLGESVLVFLPGIATISSYFKTLSEMLNTHSLTEHFRIFVLHSQVPLDDQKDAFANPPSDMVHVILATNIAESSITLPKLRMVVNFGIYHQLQYDYHRRMSCLKKKWCSHASCTQRAGRAGRVFDGVAVHLFSKKFYNTILTQYDQPEILCSPLAKLVLQAKVIGQKLGIPSPSEFLCSAIEQPSLEQMRVALKDLADLGAIASQRGQEINELAEITLLGHFSLSLPVDLGLCRLVLYGLFFGLPIEGIVIAASLSLYQDVFSLPSRAVTKDDKVFLQRLMASTDSRVYFDRGQYSDSVLVCNMFQEWLEFRNTHLCGVTSKSKYSLMLSFCRNNSVRWERLMQLESSVAQIAGKASVYLPQDHKMHMELLQLASLGSYNQGTFHLPTAGKKSRQFTRVELHFCSDAVLIKALVTAAFSNQIIVGGPEVNDPNKKIRDKAKDSLEVMKSSSVEVKDSLVMYNLPSPSISSLQALTATTIPHRYCSVTLLEKTAYISLLPRFGANPKTALMVQQAAARGENLIGTDTGNSMWNLFMTEECITPIKLAPELVYLWQFSEHQFEWSISGLSDVFTRPRHPLLARYRRLTLDGEVANTVNWRHPSRFLLASETGDNGVCIGVSATMKGSGNSYQVSVRDLTVLPNTADCCTALLLVLCFQPLHSSIDFLINRPKDRVVGMKVANQTVSFGPGQYLTRDDLVRVNALRKSLSEVLGVFAEDEALLPVEKIGSIHSLLDCVLSRSPGNLTTTSASKGGRSSKILEWNTVGCAPAGCSEDDFFEEFEFPATDDFCFYPPLTCKFMEGVEVSEIPQNHLRTGYFFDTGTDKQCSMVYSLTRGKKLKQQPEFKLSALAKSFVPGSPIHRPLGASSVLSSHLPQGVSPELSSSHLPQGASPPMQSLYHSQACFQDTTGSCSTVSELPDDGGTSPFPPSSSVPYSSKLVPSCGELASSSEHAPEAGAHSSSKPGPSSEARARSSVPCSSKLVSSPSELTSSSSKPVPDLVMDTVAPDSADDHLPLPFLPPDFEQLPSKSRSDSPVEATPTTTAASTNQNTALAVYQRTLTTTDSEKTKGCSFDVSRMGSFFPDFPGFATRFHRDLRLPVTGSEGSRQLLPYLFHSQLSQLSQEGLRQLYLFVSSFKQLLLSKGRMGPALPGCVEERRALLSSHPEASHMGLESLDVVSNMQGGGGGEYGVEEEAEILTNDVQHVPDVTIQPYKFFEGTDPLPFRPKVATTDPQARSFVDPQARGFQTRGFVEPKARGFVDPSARALDPQASDFMHPQARDPRQLGFDQFPAGFGTPGPITASVLPHYQPGDREQSPTERFMESAHQVKPRTPFQRTQVQPTPSEQQFTNTSPISHPSPHPSQYQPQNWPHPLANQPFLPQNQSGIQPRPPGIHQPRPPQNQSMYQPHPLPLQNQPIGQPCLPPNLSRPLQDLLMDQPHPPQNLSRPLQDLPMGQPHPPQNLSHPLQDLPMGQPHPHQNLPRPPVSQPHLRQNLAYPPQNQPRPPVRYKVPSYAPPPAASLLAAASNESMNKGACPDRQRAGQRRRDRKEQQIREISTFCTNQFRTRYQHPPWVSKLLCPPCKVDPAHVYKTSPAPSTVPPLQEQDRKPEQDQKTEASTQLLLNENYIPPAGSIWNNHIVTPSTSKPAVSHSGVPVYKQYGFPDDLVAMFLYNYLKVMGGRHQLCLICGPVYKYFLQSCGIAYTQKEVLPVNFFNSYTKRFSISIEPDGLVVSLKEGAGIENGHEDVSAPVTDVGVVDEVSPAVGTGSSEPPHSVMGGAEREEEGGESGPLPCPAPEALIAVVQKAEQEGANVQTSPAAERAPDYEQGAVSVLPCPPAETLHGVKARSVPISMGVELDVQMSVLTQDIPSKSSSFNLNCHSWPELSEPVPSPHQGKPEVKSEILPSAASKTYSILTESSSPLFQEHSTESWPHVDSDASSPGAANSGGGRGVTQSHDRQEGEGVRPSRPAVDLNAAQSDVSLADAIFQLKSGPDAHSAPPLGLSEQGSASTGEGEQQASSGKIGRDLLVVSEAPVSSKRPSSAPGNLRDIGEKPGPTVHVSPSAKSADMPRYSPPTARAEFNDQDFIKYCQDRLAGVGSLPYHELVSQYKKMHNLRCYIPSNYFYMRPEHFAERYKNKSLRITLAATPGQDKSVSTESRLPFTAIRSSSRPTTKSLSEQMIAKEPVPATLDSPEDVVAKEVVRILKSGSRMSFLSKIKQNVELSKLLTKHESVKLDKSFFKNRAEFEISQDCFDESADDDIYILLNKDTPGKEQQRSQSATSAPVGRYETTDPAKDQRGRSPKKDEEVRKRKKKNKGKHRHRSKEGEGPPGQDQRKSGEGRGDWRREGGESARSRSGHGGPRRGRSQYVGDWPWRSGEERGKAGRKDWRGGGGGGERPKGASGHSVEWRLREKKKGGGSGSGGWKWRGDKVNPVYGSGVPFYAQQPLSEAEN